MEWWDELLNTLAGSYDTSNLDTGSYISPPYSPADYSNLDSAMMAAGSTTLPSGIPFYLRPGFLQGAGSAIGGLGQAYAGQQAAGTQAAAADRAAALQERIYNSMAMRNQGAESLGNMARDRYGELVGLGPNTNAMGYGSAVQPFDMSKFGADPGRAFRFQSGMDALNRTAAANAGLQSGAALKAATRYGQDFGSQEYGNAYNRYQTDQAARLSPLMYAMTGGTNATNATNTAMGNMGTNVGNLMGQSAQATAAGQLGLGNSINNFAGALNNQYNTNQMMDILRDSRLSAYR